MSLRMLDFRYFTDDQKDVFFSVFERLYNEDNKFVIVSGSAGTGKTLLISKIIEYFGGFPFVSSICCALTGKAVSRMRANGIPAFTIHSLIYEVRENIDDPGNPFFLLKDPEEYKFQLTIIDEASMISEEMIDFLLQTNTKIIFVGDNKQLPPVKEEQNILNEPDFQLNEIVRTAQEDPIVQLSYEAYNNNCIPRFYNEYDNINIYDRKGLAKLVEENDYGAIICGINRTRKKVNQIVRQVRGYEDELPEVGEKLICLKNMLMENGDMVYNGMTYIVKERRFLSAGRRRYHLFDPESQNTFWTTIPNRYFQQDLNKANYEKGEENDSAFTFGYALTCHKVQGSSFERVLFLDEDVSYFLPQNRFRYTAITRASKTLDIKRTQKR